eukprot:TRINITY_DN8250_c0_g1_i1.p1 TRINITY_DN8250_c0_g1~~TRINITY_DN8250_c0_g1_i1.p1  ORF type:complete len:328 (+),score=45.10 TRINITY_DN8250_c0_g1_i1:67-984(+)
MSTDDHNAALVLQIIRAKTLFDVLSVGRDASPEEVSKSYKRLSLKVHPDKCKHPKAEEAFKRVNEAKRILVDARLREIYIQTGSTQDNPVPQHSHAHHGGGGYRRTYYNPYTRQYFYEEEDPMEDILRQFFGAGASFGPRPRFQQRQQAPRYRQTGRGAEDGGPEFDWSQMNWMPLLQMVLMLLMFLLPTFFSMYSMSSSTPKFSLKQTKDFPVEMVTLNGKVKYYLPRDFDTAYYFSSLQDQISFEQPILDAYMNAKRMECQFEQNHKLKMQNNAEREDHKQKAFDYVAAACAEVNRLRSQGVR